MNWLRVHDWTTAQSYRADRGTPPWIKVHRALTSSPKWVQLSARQRGELVSIWLLAAAHEGCIPADPGLVARMALLDEDPDLDAFVAAGWLDPST